MADKWILQLCHGYSAPFGEVARQWRVLFKGTEYRILTVFLTGVPDEQVKQLVGGDVMFLGYKSKDLRGMKIRQIRTIRKLHLKFQFCFAIAHRFKSIYIATHLPGVRVIGVSHAYGVYGRLLRKRYVMKRASNLRLVGVSNAIRDDARQALPKLPAAHIQTVYNHIDVDKIRIGQFTREEARKHLGLAEGDFVVANVGRLHPDKDQATLIKAFAKVQLEIPGARLVIIGDGRLRPDLDRQIKELGMTEWIDLKGCVPEAYRYFSAFDVFVLSSNYEPFGMVLLEAMAVPVPVISSECGGAPEVLGDAGKFFPVGNSEGLAEQLVGVYREGRERREMVADALHDRLLTLFSDEAVCQSFATLRTDWDCN